MQGTTGGEECRPTRLWNPILDLSREVGSMRLQKTLADNSGETHLASCVAQYIRDNSSGIQLNNSVSCKFLHANADFQAARGPEAAM